MAQKEWIKKENRRIHKNSIKYAIKIAKEKRERRGCKNNVETKIAEK